MSLSSKENESYFLITFVLLTGTHVLLTIHYLPCVSGSTSSDYFTKFAYKLVALADPSAWNSLLFGNIIITLILFSFRAAWWVGIGRDTFVGANDQAAAATTTLKKVQ